MWVSRPYVALPAGHRLRKLARRGNLVLNPLATNTYNYSPTFFLPPCWKWGIGSPYWLHRPPPDLEVTTVIIPIGHEQDTVRRRPWVTFGIMIACTAVLFMAAAGLLDGKVDRKTADRAVEYYFSHPYLHLDPPFSNLLDRSMGKLQVAQMVAVLREQYPPPEDQERRGTGEGETRPAGGNRRRSRRSPCPETARKPGCGTAGGSSGSAKRA